MMILFWVFAIATCAAAIAVVVAQNVVHMAFYLVVTLGSVAGLFFLLGADFLGAVQLLIYVGGTVVLLIFGIMLTATGPLSGQMTLQNGERILAGIVGLSLLGIMSVSMLSVDWAALPGNPAPFVDGGTTRPLGLKLLGLDTATITNRPSDGVGYLLPFEIASIHLLVVLIGAAYLARAKRRPPEQDEMRGDL